MSSLQGYVKATYSEVLQAFGEPTYAIPSADGKVDTEWEMFDEEAGQVTLYDWKCYGHIARDGQPYRWHIGGDSRKAVEVVSNRLNRNAWHA